MAEKAGVEKEVKEKSWWVQYDFDAVFAREWAFAMMEFYAMMASWKRRFFDDSWDPSTAHLAADFLNTVYEAVEIPIRWEKAEKESPPIS